MCGVDDCRVLAETAGALEQLDRTEAVLGETLLDLARLLVGVNVERDSLGGGVATDLLEPLGRTRAHRVGRDTDPEAACSCVIDLAEVGRNRGLTEACEAAASVRGKQEHERDPGLLGRLGGGERLVVPEVVELADGRVPGPPELAIDLGVLAAHELGRLPLGLGEHPVSPRPEVVARRAAPQRPLERVAVRVDEARHRERLAHTGIVTDSARTRATAAGSVRAVGGGLLPTHWVGRRGRCDARLGRRVGHEDPDYPCVMSARAVPAPLQQLPNALTVVRLLLIPVFVALMLAAEGGHSWPAGIVFAIAGVTDQVDGYLARRWQVESSFGRVADPLADRLMIDAAVILLYVNDHMPLLGLILILGRDVVLMLGYKAIAPRGYELQVTLVGKIGTWLLYAGIGLLIVTSPSTHWPYLIFWAGVVLAVVAGIGYVIGARREMQR